MRRTILFAILTTTWTGEAASQQVASTRWFTTWTASMAVVPQVNVQAVSGRTMRQIILVSLGGRRLRVRLSNEWGDRPLAIGSAHVAVRDTGSMIVEGTSRALTFGNRPAVVVGPGAVVLSDPVDFNVPTRGSLAISLFFPDTAFVSTFAIGGGGRPSYTSTPGDFSGAQRLPVESIRGGWMFLTGVDVVNDNAKGTIVVFGSSIAGGTISALPGSRLSEVLAQRLLTSREGPMLGVVSATINGNRVLGGGRGRPLLGRFERDVLGQSGVTHLIVMEGLNDAAFAYAGTPPVTAGDIIRGLSQVAQQAREHGLIVLAGTLTPSEGTTYGAPERRWGSAEEDIRSAVNTWIRNTRVFDGYIDFDACVRDPQHPARLQAKYDGDDGLHLNDNGNRALGDCVDLALFRPRSRR